MQHTPIITKKRSVSSNECEEYSVYLYDKTCLEISLCQLQKEVKHLLYKIFNEKGTYEFNISARINITDWSGNNTHKITSDPIKVTFHSVDLDESIKDLLDQYKELNE